MIPLNIVRAPLAVLEPDTSAVLDANESCVRLLQSSSKDELLGKSMTELLGLDVTLTARSTFEMHHVLTVVPRAHIGKLYVHLNVHPLPGTAFLLLEMRNDTDVRRAEQQVDGIVETSFDGLWDRHLEGDTEYTSPEFWEMLGYGNREKKCYHSSERYDIMHPEDKERDVVLLKEHIKTRGKTPYYLETRYRHKNGSTVHVLCKGRVVSWGGRRADRRNLGITTALSALVNDAVHRHNVRF